MIKILLPVISLFCLSPVFGQVAVRETAHVKTEVNLIRVDSGMVVAISFQNLTDHDLYFPVFPPMMLTYVDGSGGFIRCGYWDRYSDPLLGAEMKIHYTILRPDSVLSLKTELIEWYGTNVSIVYDFIPSTAIFHASDMETQDYRELKEMVFSIQELEYHEWIMSEYHNDLF